MTPASLSGPEVNSLVEARLMAVTPEVAKPEAKGVAARDLLGTREKEAIEGDVREGDGVGVGALRKTEAISKTSRAASLRS